MSPTDNRDASLEITPLDTVIRDYLIRIDRGETISREEFLAAHPDLHDDLLAFFDGVARVQQLAGVQSTLTDTSQATKYGTVATPVPAPVDSLPQTANMAVKSELTGPFPMMFGQYRVLRSIGQGAMGAVYVAEDIRLGRQVALKVPLRSAAEQSDYLDRFIREAQASARLRHHNICPVYEVNEVNGIQYIAMAYIEGMPLSEVIRGTRRFAGKQIAVTIRKIAYALEVAHQAGIVHRDLKPANIMIDKSGEPIVMDFGLARQIHAADQVQLTQEGVILGTPAYMSPEQVRSELKRIGPGSDIYSLGVILYELLCGRHPFSGPLMTVLMNVANEQTAPPSPSVIRSNCDPLLEAICLKMMSKKIADRYSSMKDVAAALSDYIKTGKTSAEIPTTPAPAPEALPEPVVVVPAVDAPIPEVAHLAPLSASGGRPPRRRLKLAFGGLGAVLLMGVIIITITTNQGKTVIKVPEGTAIDIPATPGAKISIEISKDPNPPKVGTKSVGWHGWPADAPPPAIAPFNADQAKNHQQAWAEYLKVPVEHTNSIGMKFVLIPPGEFTMGSSQQEIDAALKEIDPTKFAGWHSVIPFEAPRHQVTITHPLYVGMHEIRQVDYETVVGINPTHTAARKNHPVEGVGWFEAVTFCIKLGELEKLKPYYFLDSHKSGDGYRLLTEAEWEYSCRAGTTQRHWCGDIDESLTESGWFDKNSNGQPHEVGTLRPNPFGIHDMLGNVWELLEDGWNPDSYNELAGQPTVNPVSPIQDYPDRAMRGGSFNSPAYQCRCATRTGLPIEDRHVTYGFRVALTVDAVRLALNVHGPKVPMLVASRPSNAPGFSAERTAAKNVLQADGTLVLESGERISANGAMPFVPSAVREVWLQGAKVSENDLMSLQALPKLKTLSLDQTQFTGRGLATYLTSWPRLTKLSLHGTSFTGGHLDLSGCPHIRELHCPPTLTNEELENVIRSCPTLKSVNLAGATGLTVAPLRKLLFLAELTTGGDLLTDEGVQALAAIPSLQRLTLTAPVNDEIVSRVAALGAQLQTLEIVPGDDNSSELTNVGYTALAKSLRLFELSIRGKTGAPTPAVLMAVTAAMPDLRSVTIHCDDADKTFPPSVVADVHRQYPAINLKIGTVVMPALHSWPSGPDGGVASWALPEGAPPPAIAPYSAESARQTQTAWAKFLNLEVEIKNSVEMPLRLIPPGEFIYPYPSRKPPHVGRIDESKRSLARIGKPYYIGATEVTIQQFSAFVAETGYKTTAEKGRGGILMTAVNPETFENFNREIDWKKPGLWTPRPGDPVTQLSWEDATAYCKWLSKKEGAIYRLPREMEWFHAFWAGSTLKWGIADSTEEMIQTTRFLNSIPHPLEETTSPYLLAGNSAANAFGLHEMLGNVWEWASEDVFSASPNEQYEEHYSLRQTDSTLNLGGGWEAAASNLVSPWINVPNSQDKYYPNLGFRVLREVEYGIVDGVPANHDIRLIRHGRPLSPIAKISQPARIEGLRSWSVEPKHHIGSVQSIAHHPSEAILATGGSDGAVRLWKATGELGMCLMGHSAFVNHVQFIDEGKKLLSGDGGGQLRIWNTMTGASLKLHQSRGQVPVALSHDEKTIVTYFENDQLIFVNAETGALNYQGAVGGCSSFAWSPDDKYLATTSAESAIHIWQVNPWKQVAKIPVNDYHFYYQLHGNLSWSPDGKIIAFNQRVHESVCLIDASTFKLLPSLKRSTPGGFAPVWSHDSRNLAITSERITDVFDMVTKNERFTIKNAEFVCWSPDDLKVHTGTGESYDAVTGSRIHEWKSSQLLPATKTSLSPDGQLMTTTDESGQTSLWNAATGDLKSRWKSGLPQSPVSWMPDGRSVVTHTDGILQVRDPSSGQSLSQGLAGGEQVREYIFSPDGHWLATSPSNGNRLRVRDAHTGQNKWDVDVERSPLHKFAWSPDGAQLVTCHPQAEEIRIWSAQDGRMLKSYSPASVPHLVPLAERLRDVAYIQWSFEDSELLIGNPFVGFRFDLDTQKARLWYFYALLGGHASRTTLAPNRHFRVYHTPWAGYTWYTSGNGPDFTFLGQQGDDSAWMPDNRRILMLSDRIPPKGYDLATQRNLGTLFTTTVPNVWLCIGSTGHYRSGFIDQAGEGTDPKALKAVEDFVVYVAQLEDGSQVTYSPQEFAQKYGWTNDPTRATLMDFND